VQQVLLGTVQGTSCPQQTLRELWQREHVWMAGHQWLVQRQVLCHHGHHPGCTQLGSYPQLGLGLGRSTSCTCLTMA
jgi:hypothetical protein